MEDSGRRTKCKRTKQTKSKEFRTTKIGTNVKRKQKAGFGGRRVLGMQSRVKGLYILKEHPVLDPLLQLLWGQTPKSIEIKINRKRDQGKTFLSGMWRQASI